MINSLTGRGRIKNILKLLREERNIILHGPLHDLNRLAARRDMLVDRLIDGKIVLDETDIKSLRQEALRNQTLLSACLSGIAAAQKLLVKQNHAATTMGTYTDSGERVELLVAGDQNSKVV